MIHIVECEKVTCDNCNEIFEEWGTGFTIFHEDAIQRAMDCEWGSQDDKQYCPKCYETDEDDNLIVKQLNAN